jgi:predicted RNase H-like nuclease (RuvC/YqgF family)
MYLRNKIVHSFHEFFKLISLTNQNGITTEIISMEDAQRTYIHEDEVRGLYFNMGNQGTKSNGHREGKEESMNLVETIKSLQKYVQSYKDDNERLMKSKEQQEGFNIKLMKSLDRIEKKMDKEIESSKSRSHRSHDERIKNKKY